MIIEISTESLKEFGISADDYLYLYLIHQKAHDVLVSLSLRVDPEALQTKGFIKLGDKIEDHIVREKFLRKNFTPFEQLWSELVSHFPLKVTDKRGSVRVLRSKDPNTLTIATAKKKYYQYLKANPNKHNEVVKALETELKIRRDGDTMHFMQMLSTWVNQHTWEKYIGIDTNEQEDQRRITRKL